MGKCPRCQGSLVVDLEGVDTWKCVACGRYWRRADSLAAPAAVAVAAGAKPKREKVVETKQLACQDCQNVFTGVSAARCAACTAKVNAAQQSDRKKARREAAGVVLDVRCTACKKLLAKAIGRPWVITCSRCHTRNSMD